MTPRSWHYHADEAIARERRKRPIAKAIPSYPSVNVATTEGSDWLVFLAPAMTYLEALLGTTVTPDGKRMAVYDGHRLAFLRSEALSGECDQHDQCWPDDHRGEADEWVAGLATVGGVLIVDEYESPAW